MSLTQHWTTLFIQPFIHELNQQTLSKHLLWEGCYPRGYSWTSLLWCLPLALRVLHWVSRVITNWTVCGYTSLKMKGTGKDYNWAKGNWTSLSTATAAWAPCVLASHTRQDIPPPWSHGSPTTDHVVTSVFLDTCAEHLTPTFTTNFMFSLLWSCTKGIKMKIFKRSQLLRNHSCCNKEIGKKEAFCKN